MRRKEKEKKKRPILYEKYKRDNHLVDSSEIVEEKESAFHYLIKMLEKMLQFVIYIALILLASVGAVTLLNEELRVMWMAVMLTW